MPNNPKKEVIPKKRVRQVVEEVVPQVDDVPTPAPQETPSVEGFEAAVQVPDTPQVQEAAPPTTPINQNINYSDKPSFFKLLLLTVGVALGVAITGGSLYVYFSGISKVKSNVPEKTPSSTLPPTATPFASSDTSASPSATPNLGSYKISVLNGSGKIGVASDVKTILAKAGFTVTSTGNAQSFDYTSTIIQVKPNVDASVVDILKKALSGSYQVKVGDKLDLSNSFDIVITVGSS